RVLAEGRYSAEPVDELTPERLFDRRWATGLLDRALARLEAESSAAGKSDLMSRLLPALTGGRGEVPFAAITAELGMTEGAVKMAASRLRKRYGEILREEIAHGGRPGRGRGGGPGAVRCPGSISSRGFV